MLPLLLEMSNRISTFKLKSNEGLIKGTDLHHSFIHLTICIKGLVFQVSCWTQGVQR